MFLGDFGAEVYKVEHPEIGDGMRRWGAKKDGIGLFFKVVNRNKKTITVNLKQPEGQELIRRIVRKLEIDVVVENYRTGTLERWGIGYEQLRAVKPDIIVAHITGYGRTGPMAKERALGTLGEALSGCAYVNGYADRPPLLPAFGLGDASTGLFTAFGVVMALYHRSLSGAGQEIDLGLYEGLFTLLGTHVVDYDQLGIVAERGEMSNVAPRGTYQTADGRWVALSGGTGKTFERIAEAIGISYVLQDERLKDNAARLNHTEEIDKIVRAAVRALTFDDLMERLGCNGAPVGPVLSIAQIFEHPQYQARENIVAVNDDELGRIRMQNVVPKFSRSPGAVRFAGQPKGAFTDEVLLKEVGLTAAEVTELRSVGAI